MVEFLRGIATGSKGDVGVRGLRLWSDTPVGCKNILKQASKTARGAGGGNVAAWCVCGSGLVMINQLMG